MSNPKQTLNVDLANPWNATSPMARRFRGFWSYMPGYESGAVVPELVTWGTRRFDVPLVSVSNSPGATSGIVPGNNFYPFPSLKLPGSASYAVQAAEDSWTEIPRNLGMCAWVYTAADSTQRSIFGKFSQTGNQRSYLLDILNTNVFRILWSYDGINSQSVSSAAVTAGWYFVAGCINQSTSATATMRLFVGTPGQRVRLSGSGNVTAGVIFDGTAPISIGAMSNTGGAFFWKGNIGACGLVDGVPNEDEWNDIAQEGWRGFPTLINRIAFKPLASSATQPTTGWNAVETFKRESKKAKGVSELTTPSYPFTTTTASPAGWSVDDRPQRNTKSKNSKAELVTPSFPFTTTTSSTAWGWQATEQLPATKRRTFGEKRDSFDVFVPQLTPWDFTFDVERGQGLFQKKRLDTRQEIQPLFPVFPATVWGWTVDAGQQPVRVNRAKRQSTMFVTPESTAGGSATVLIPNTVYSLRRRVFNDVRTWDEFTSLPRG